MIQVVVCKDIVSGHPLIKFEADPSTGRAERIALYGNFRKCGLKYHLKCINYGQSKLVDLFVITMAICMPNLIKVYALLVELLPK